MGIHLHHPECLQLITPALVVEYYIGIDGNTIIVQRLNTIMQFLFGAVLGAHSAFLIKLPQVV